LNYTTKLHERGVFSCPVSIDEYHDPAEVDPDTFYFDGRHNFHFDSLTTEEASAMKI
jgi:hypothetical protein